MLRIYILSFSIAAAASTYAETPAPAPPPPLRHRKTPLELAGNRCARDERRVDARPRPLQDPRPRSARARTQPQPTLEEARETWLDPLERQYLTDLLAKHGGNVKKAAEAAGINTVTLYRLLKRRGLHLGRTVKAS